MTVLIMSDLQRSAIEVFNNPYTQGEVLNMMTDQGNKIIMSDQDYRNLMATLEIYANPRYLHEIIEAGKTPIEECLSGEDI